MRLYIYFTLNGCCVKYLTNNAKVTETSVHLETRFCTVFFQKNNLYFYIFLTYSFLKIKKLLF